MKKEQQIKEDLEFYDQCKQSRISDVSGSAVLLLNDYAKKVHENAKSKGFFDTEKNIGEILCLIHSEVSEALEADRNNKHTTYNMSAMNGWVTDDDFKHEFSKNVKNTFEDELADIIIRVLDLCAFKNIDIESHIKAKMRYNETRPHKHGKSY